MNSILIGIGFLTCVYLGVKFVMKGFIAARCPRCDGEGTWAGMRGERNHCEQCNGTGKA